MKATITITHLWVRNMIIHVASLTTISYKNRGQVKFTAEEGTVEALAKEIHEHDTNLVKPGQWHYMTNIHNEVAN